ncbi:MAG: hypothetical protein AAF604_06400 [Acidobacteriota bacterium]
MIEEPQEESPPAAIYEGRPKLPEAPGESKRWRRFVRWLRRAAPWLGNKRELGEAYLKALVEQELAKARLTNAQATKTLVEAEYVALQTAEKAADLDERSSQTRQVVVDAQQASFRGDEPELVAQVEALQRKVELLRAKYGLEILLLGDPSDQPK